MPEIFTGFAHRLFYSKSVRDATGLALLPRNFKLKENLNAKSGASQSGPFGKATPQQPDPALTVIARRLLATKQSHTLGQIASSFVPRCRNDE